MSSVNGHDSMMIVDPFGEQYQPLGSYLVSSQDFPKGSTGYISKGKLVATPAAPGDTPLAVLDDLAVDQVASICLNLQPEDESLPYCVRGANAYEIDAYRSYRALDVS